MAANIWESNKSKMAANNWESNKSKMAANIWKYKLDFWQYTGDGILYIRLGLILKLFCFVFRNSNEGHKSYVLMENCLLKIAMGLLVTTGSHAKRGSQGEIFRNKSGKCSGRELRRNIPNESGKSSGLLKASKYLKSGMSAYS